MKISLPQWNGRHRPVEAGGGVGAGQRPAFRARSSRPRSRLLIRAMTLMEVMIAATLMSVIIYALYTMFDRVQRVLRGANAQVDVLESGRMATEMIERDLEQMNISNGTDQTNVLRLVDYTTNSTVGWTVPLTLPDGTVATNELHSLFFITRPDSWKAIGYRIAHPTNVTEPPPNGVGTLYRFERTIVSPGYLLHTNNSATQQLTNNPIYRFTCVYNANNAAPLEIVTNDFSRVLDGVVNFQCRIIAYSSSAVATAANTNYYETDAIEQSRLPAFVEVDMSLIEPKVLEQVRALPAGAPAAINILTNQFGKVHTFTQRIPIRMRP